MNLRTPTAITVLATALLLGACGDASGPGTPQPAQLLPLGGDGQTGRPGEQLPNPLLVAVRDFNGMPIAGVTVAFTVSRGGGSVSPQDAVTNADGVASTRWTLGGDDIQIVGASVDRRRADPLVAEFTAIVQR